MPVFVDNANSSRDLRVLPSLAPPLPCLVEASSSNRINGVSEVERYDVVVVGAGPSGLFLTLLLARYGLRDDRLLCLDSKPGTLKSGQADGLQPRTLEVLHSLGLAEEVLKEGCQMWEVAFWNPTASGGIERTSYVPDVAVPAMFPHEVTIHQGRIERILSDDLSRYSQRGVKYSSRVSSIILDEGGDSQYPVVIEYDTIDTEQKGDPPAASARSKHCVRTKHVVGADGAHSVVRRSIGLDLMGESKDLIWGVVDLVVDTDFPDIRRRCAIHSNAGSVMVIPRERIATGDYLTRLYVQVGIEVPADEISGEDVADPTTMSSEARQKARERRSKITMEGILKQAQTVFHPYHIKLKENCNVDWWAAYQIGQRMTEKFAQKDCTGVPRVFISGDACHTHSPKAGQGMNVSMMDSYNLSWKLAYHLNGLVPTSSRKAGVSADLLDSYEFERREIARELIEFDTKFSSMFSGSIGKEDDDKGLTHEQFVEVFSTGNGFTSGCGIEYSESDSIWKEACAEGNPIQGTDYLGGTLRPGRRLLSTRVIRHADGNPRELQDDFSSNGRYKILILTSTDLTKPEGRSSKALLSVAGIMNQFPTSVIELVVLHALEHTRSISWKDLPSEIKQYAEMRFHSAWPGEAPTDKFQTRNHMYKAEDAYGIYGVSRKEGAACIVRPDGYVAMVTSLDKVEDIRKYFERWLQPRQIL
ncbi:hypothetical protein MMC26_002627 [Xylographa opegraphella]|nr:hypothetical protein [Xylographa opegraphella]